MVGVSGDAVSCFGADGKGKRVSTVLVATLFTIHGAQRLLVTVLLGHVGWRGSNILCCGFLMEKLSKNKLKNLK